MPYLAAPVYLLCLLTSAICAGLLVRSWHRNRSRLLLWSVVCFVLLAVNNCLVVVDIMLLPKIDLRLYRELATFVALGFLLYGFIWDLDR
jgi:hypothetical protein